MILVLVQFVFQVILDWGSNTAISVDQRNYRQKNSSKELVIKNHVFYFFLFNRTIRENIALVDPSIPMERVVAAVKMAGAHEFIVELQEGYDAIVGEQGSNLSGGQRQRLAIARALINNPRILIFDEATSTLDYESERLIQNNMAAICKNRTVFIIAHRLTTVRQCNRIIVMEKGQVVEQGDHASLLAQKGYYAKLHSYQNTPVKAKRANQTNVHIAESPDATGFHNRIFFEKQEELATGGQP